MSDETHDKAESQRNQSLNNWYPGMKSPNPGGRPKAIARVVELARAHTEEAIKTLYEIMKDEKASRNARIAAANSLVDRGWGKPLTVSALFDFQPGDDNPVTSLESARRIAFILAKAKREQIKLQSLHMPDATPALIEPDKSE